VEYAERVWRRRWNGSVPSSYALFGFVWLGLAMLDLVWFGLVFVFPVVSGL